MSAASPTTFRMRLDVPAGLAGCSGCPDPLAYSSALDDVRSIFSDLCGVFADQGGFNFVVAGFGEWRATVRTDLMVVLEQLPAILAALRTEQPAELDFFEQGLQRSVWIRTAGGEVVLSCTSRLPSWTPPGDEIRMPRAELENMLKDLAQAFLDAANVACPGMASHPWLLAWANELTVRGHGEQEP